MTAYIFSILCLLLLSAFFSATETAFTSLNRIKMKNMANDDVKNAKLVLKLEDRYDKLLSTILIGNNIANIGMTAIATVMFVALLGGSLGPTASTVVTDRGGAYFRGNLSEEHCKTTPWKGSRFLRHRLCGG